MEKKKTYAAPAVETLDLTPIHILAGTTIGDGFVEGETGNAGTSDGEGWGDIL